MTLGKATIEVTFKGELTPAGLAELTEDFENKIQLAPHQHGVNAYLFEVTAEIIDFSVALCVRADSLEAAQSHAMVVTKKLRNTLQKLIDLKSRGSA